MQHEVCLYEWAIMYDSHKAEDEFGETSTVACLISALAGLRSEENLVELTHQGVHMGDISHETHIGPSRCVCVDRGRNLC